MADSTEATEAPTQEQFAALVAEREALLAKNREVLSEAKKAKEFAARYKDVDPDEYKTLKQKAAEAAERKAVEEGTLESWKKQFTEQFAKEREPLVTENKTLRGALERRLVDAEATSAIAAAKGSPKVLLPHIKAHVKVVEEEGEFVAVVIDARGNERIGDARGTRMTIAQLVDELKQDADFARNFEGTGSSGGGASKSNASGGGARTIAASDIAANLDGVLDGSVRVA